MIYYATSYQTPGASGAQVSHWSARRWTVAAVVALVLGLLTGVPTGIMETPFYTRMTPVLWWNYPVWALAAVLAGLLAATYDGTGAAGAKGVSGRVGVGSVMSGLAVGCPVCNKVVVALLGVSGALGIWAPLQPLLGVSSVALLGVALWLRLRTPPVCDLPTARGEGVTPEAQADPQSLQDFVAPHGSEGFVDRPARAPRSLTGRPQGCRSPRRGR